MIPSIRPRALSAIAILCAASAVGLAVFALVANNDRWNEGPVVLPLVRDHGFHLMDLLLISASILLGVLAVRTGRLARRQVSGEVAESERRS